jgi:hypothetical protein
MGSSTAFPSAAPYTPAIRLPIATTHSSCDHWYAGGWMSTCFSSNGNAESAPAPAGNDLELNCYEFGIAPLKAGQSYKTLVCLPFSAVGTVSARIPGKPGKD